MLACYALEAGGVFEVGLTSLVICITVSALVLVGTQGITEWAQLGFLLVCLNGVYRGNLGDEKYIIIFGHTYIYNMADNTYHI